ATYGAFSRRWIPGGGVGHVFESRNGGTSWTDISGNLPDIPTNGRALWGLDLSGPAIGTRLLPPPRTRGWGHSHVQSAASDEGRNIDRVLAP
ncbi:MAG: hypothetical protein ACR2J0_05455, partial [Mycobacteriales bacterium]